MPAITDVATLERLPEGETISVGSTTWTKSGEQFVHGAARAGAEAFVGDITAGLVTTGVRFEAGRMYQRNNRDWKYVPIMQDGDRWQALRIHPLEDSTVGLVTVTIPETATVVESPQVALATLVTVVEQLRAAQRDSAARAGYIDPVQVATTLGPLLDRNEGVDRIRNTLTNVFGMQFAPSTVDLWARTTGTIPVQAPIDTLQAGLPAGLTARSTNVAVPWTRDFVVTIPRNTGLADQCNAGNAALVSRAMLQAGYGSAVVGNYSFACPEHRERIANFTPVGPTYVDPPR